MESSPFQVLSGQPNAIDDGWEFGMPAAPTGTVERESAFERDFGTPTSVLDRE